MIHPDDIYDASIRKWHIENMSKNGFDFYKWDNNKKIVVAEANEKIIEMTGMPLFIDVEFHNWCNFECIHCPIGHTNEDIDQNSMRILYELMPTAEIIEIGKAAEPMLKPDQMLDFFKNVRNINPLVKIFLLANGSALSKKMAQILIDYQIGIVHVSIDSHDTVLFNQFRIGGNLEQIKDNLLYLKELKKNNKSSLPIVVVNCQMTGFADPFQMVKFVQTHGCDGLVFSRTQSPSTKLDKWVWQSMYSKSDLIYILDRCKKECADSDINFGHTSIFDIPLYKHDSKLMRSFWDKTISAQYQSPGLEPICHSKAPWMRWCSSLDKVSPCCWHDTIGNMKTINSYNEIWNGPGYKKLRTSFRNNTWPTECMCRA